MFHINLFINESFWQSHRKPSGASVTKRELDGNQREGSERNVDDGKKKVKVNELRFFRSRSSEATRDYSESPPI